MASIITGVVTVSSAGTAVQFSTAQDPLRSIRIVVATGTCYVGDSTVDSTNSPALAVTEELSLDWTVGKPGVLSDLWVDAANNNDAIRYWAVPL